MPSLGPGVRVGPYEIVSALGAGGMGEVYRARDSKLGRDVAIKVLPSSLTSDPDRLARFSREAQVLASLNHPNIAGIYHVEETADGPAIVMELVEGETLADRIGCGTIPVDEALPIAKQIAEALEAAHEHGIIHRDLKPANIKVRPDGSVKVLDFGLAKLNEPPLAAVSGALSLSPTLTSPAMMTGVATLLGTAAYMAPEQAKGAVADHRSDIFSFGCVFYELLTGRQAFAGESVTEILASVIKGEAELALLPRQLHPRVSELIRRCLAKDPKRRWQAAGDLRMELEAVLADPRGLGTAANARVTQQPLWRRAVPFVATAIIAAAVTATAAWFVRPTPADRITRFSILLPDRQELTRTGRHNIAVSPDGESIVYVADGQLYLRRMTDIEPRPINGTKQDVNTPFFSPDGQWIGFYAVPEGKLKKIATTGGASVTIANATNPYGATWNADDRIVIGQGVQGIGRVSANGGAIENLIKVMPGEFAHGPQILPDGDHVLFTLAKGTTTKRWDQAQVVVQSLRTGERTVLINGGSDARYVPTGHLVYALGANLLAVPFDARSLRATSGPVPIVEGIGRSAPSNTAAMFYAFSGSGTLAYFTGDGPVDTGFRLVRVDRHGTSTPLPVAVAAYANPRVSPDGKQLAVQVDSEEGGSNIWIYDLAGALAPRRLTFGGSNTSPAWTPDGRYIVFVSNRDGNTMAIFRQRSDGSGSVERLTDPKAAQPTWVRVSKSGIAVYRDGRGDGDIWTVSLIGDHKVQPVIQDPANQTDATLSPDGRWIAYSSTEVGAGASTVYVRPFPPTGAKYQIATTDAHDPLWSADGRQLFYLAAPFGGATHRMISVDVRTDSGFSFGNPTPMLDNVVGAAESEQSPYDITPDGRQFIVRTASGAASATAPRPEIRITVNWFDELKARVPVK